MPSNLNRVAFLHDWQVVWLRLVVVRWTGGIFRDRPVTVICDWRTYLPHAVRSQPGAMKCTVVTP